MNKSCQCTFQVITFLTGSIAVFFYKNSNFEYSTHISYLEIYNDAGYDLLDPRHEAAKLEDLPYVCLLSVVFVIDVGLHSSPEVFLDCN